MKSWVKAMNKKLCVFITVAAIFFIMGTHLAMLVKVSKMQLEIKNLEKQLEESKKELQIRTSEFEEKLDFVRIRRIAEEEFGMEISDQIEYIRVD